MRGSWRSLAAAYELLGLCRSQLSAARGSWAHKLTSKVLSWKAAVNWGRKPLKTYNSLALELYLAFSYYFLLVEPLYNDSLMH